MAVYEPSEYMRKLWAAIEATPNYYTTYLNDWWKANYSDLTWDEREKVKSIMFKTMHDLEKVKKMPHRSEWEKG